MHCNYKKEISEPLLRIDTAANTPGTPPSSSAETRLYGLVRACSPPPYAAGIHTALKIHTHRTGKYPALTEIS